MGVRRGRVILFLSRRGVSRLDQRVCLVSSQLRNGNLEDGYYICAHQIRQALFRF